ncbi:MAG: Fe-S cluster assembly protein SufD [Chthoniobacteraceae bacterium]
MSDTLLMPTELCTPTADENTSLLAQPEIASDLPATLQNARSEAWSTFESLPMPKRTDETWRFTNLKSIDLTSFVKPLPVSDEVRAQLLDRSVGQSEVAGRMVFANDQLLKREVLVEELKAKGVIWEPLEKAATEHAELFSKHFMAQDVILGGQKFAALHEANVRTGTFLYVPKNVEIELPLEVFHWLSGANGSTFPHTLIIAGANSKVTLVDYFESAEQMPGFACGVNDLYLEPGAKLTYVCVQQWSQQTQAFQINNTTVDRDASATSLLLNLGSKYARSESVSRLAGTGGRSDMLSVSVAEGEQEIDQRTFQIHQVPNTTSDLLYKNSLDDTARTTFSGLIRVEPGAHRTDAYQKVRNLLLSDEAEANSAPGLEIEANDVRCTHGATSGQIEQEELFYLLSRGITRQQAQKLIVLGFLNEVFERLGDEKIAESLQQKVEARFTR